MSAAKSGMILLAAVALTACAPKETLRPAAISAGPDEFGVVPNRLLEPPEDFASLPAPTPQGSNLADVTPKADAVIALGGRPASETGVDGGIVNYVSRYGVDPNIRADLEESDNRVLKSRGFFAFPWSKNKYERAYRRFALDPYAEWERLRAAGVVVPSAPPQD
ncbi:DUF3035 domain-containing protein [Celeribacter sp.]|uniref:DUF3035 domain-containing protein n=1 Tax=Celeribacter sp. TaxID=1890673 RepID=UPI003A935413